MSASQLLMSSARTSRAPGAALVDGARGLVVVPGADEVLFSTADVAVAVGMAVNVDVDVADVADVEVEDDVMVVAVEGVVVEDEVTVGVLDEVDEVAALHVPLKRTRPVPFAQLPQWSCWVRDCSAMSLPPAHAPP